MVYCLGSASVQSFHNRCNGNVRAEPKIRLIWEIRGRKKSFRFRPKTLVPYNFISSFTCGMPASSKGSEQTL